MGLLIVEEDIGAEGLQERAFFQSTQEERLVDSDADRASPEASKQLSLDVTAVRVRRRLPFVLANNTQFARCDTPPRVWSQPRPIYDAFRRNNDLPCAYGDNCNRRETNDSSFATDFQSRRPTEQLATRKTHPLARKPGMASSATGPKCASCQLIQRMMS